MNKILKTLFFRGNMRPISFKFGGLGEVGRVDVYINCTPDIYYITDSMNCSDP